MVWRSSRGSRPGRSLTGPAGDIPAGTRLGGSHLLWPRAGAATPHLQEGVGEGLKPLHPSVVVDVDSRHPEAELVAAILAVGQIQLAVELLQAGLGWEGAEFPFLPPNDFLPLVSSTANQNYLNNTLRILFIN